LKLDRCFPNEPSTIRLEDSRWFLVPHWLQPFSEGLFHLADAQGIELMGGDTTRGPLAISITVIGSVPSNQALKRTGASTPAGRLRAGSHAGAGR
jgi:thiamine-monophosphate kinase